MRILAAFLGNPGTAYAHTRHNFGKMVCSGFEQHAGSLSWKDKFRGRSADLPADGPNRVTLLCPGGYMNTSGESIGTAARYFSIVPAQVVIIHDDLETPFGTITGKFGGGLGGHNGLKSAARSLGTNDFYRLKLGIGRPRQGTPSAYVLSRFDPVEEARLPDIIDAAVSVLCQVFAAASPSAFPTGIQTLFPS